MDFDRWDVVTVLFPFRDIPVRKPRPVLVMSNAGFNRDQAHLAGTMITTGPGSSWPSDHRIDDLGAAGLPRPSLVRWKVFTLPYEMLGRRLGALAEFGPGRD